MGNDLRSRARACAAAGQVCGEKGFLAESLACRRPSLGRWIIFSVAKAGFVGTVMRRDAVHCPVALQGLLSIVLLPFSILDYLFSALVKQKPN